MNKLNEESSKKQKIGLKNIFYNNTFVLIFSLLCAIVIWFIMAENNEYGEPRRVDVPISIQLSDAAKTEGVRVFSQSIKQATVSITGSNFVIDKISAEEMTVVGNLSPATAKLTGNTLQTETVPLTAMKGNAYADYEIEAVVPKEMTVVYDRYKESTFTIENNMKITTNPGYFVYTPQISESQVVVSGPESAVNKVSRVSIDYEIQEPISESKSFNCALTAYDGNNKKMALSDLYLELSVDSVDVELNVLNQQAAELKVTTLNVPEGFSESRITVEPESINIAGDLETVSKYSTITLPKAIDFNEVNTKNNVYEMEIPMPTGVTNVSKIDKAKVTINLNGFTESSITTKNLKLVNVPEEKNADLVTKSLTVEVVGSTAQVSRLTPDSIYGTIDMAKMTEKNGNIEVPVTVGVSGATSCWIYGKYTIHVSVQDKAVEAQAQVSSGNGAAVQPVD